MIIGIIAAMDNEVKTIKNSFKTYEKEVIAGVKIYKAQVNDNTCILVRGGIGKANIAHATSLVLNKYKPNLIINTGIAGGLDPLKPGDLLIASQLTYSDVDATGFGYEIGQVPGMPKYYIADDNYLNKIKFILKDLDINYKSGSILSGDSFVTNRSMLKFIPSEEYVGIDMEGASVAQICYLYKTAFVSLRFISDSIDSPNQELEYQAFENDAAETSASICLNVLNRLH